MPSDQDPAFAGRRHNGAIVASSTVVLAVAAMLSSLRPLQLEMPGDDLDASWVVVMGEAAMRPARWGIDLMFTYGPASALVTRYFTEHYLVRTLPILCGIGLVFALCFACLTGRAVARHEHPIGLTVLVIMDEAVALFLAGANVPDAFFFTFGLVVYLLDLVRRPRDRVALLAVVAGATALGVLSMSKTSFGVLALLLFALADARALIETRRLPLLTPVFGVAAVATFVAYGQRLGDLGTYLRLQGDSVAGYGEAMYIVGDPRELLAFLVAAAGLVVAALVSEPPRRTRRLFAVIGIGLVVSIALKGGFIRADAHQQIGWAILGLSGCATAVAFLLPRSVNAAAALGAASLLLLGIVAPLFSLADNEQPLGWTGLADAYAADLAGLEREAAAWTRLVRDPEAFAGKARADKTAAWTAIRANHPIPALPGSVDVISSEQSIILANGLDYRSRPSFQDYATYTAAQIEANLAFYRGASAPDWVLISSDAIDERYPTSIEGALWPDLLARYTPERRVADWLVLHRRTTPLADVLGEPKTFGVALGQSFKVPPGPVFARITVRKTLLGRLAAAIFRPASLNLRVRLADGAEHTYRFVPALGAEGFVLSPPVEGVGDLAMFFSGRGADLGDKAVTEVAVSGSSGVRLFYDSDVLVTLQAIDMPRVEPTPQIGAVLDEASRKSAWRRLARQIDPKGSLEGDRLSIPAPTALTVPTGGAGRLRLGFGIEDGAWTTGRTEGVCFSVGATSDAPEPLWRRCLDPLGVAADRGPQTATVDLPVDSAAVTVATTCPKSCDWGWSYLDSIEKETNAGR